MSCHTRRGFENNCEYTGEGGLHKELYPYSGNVIVQVASGRFGVHSEYLNTSAMVEIKIGQGANPGSVLNFMTQP